MSKSNAWPEEYFYKIWHKPYAERLAIAGAMIAAEIDRHLMASQEPTHPKGTTNGHGV